MSAAGDHRGGELQNETSRPANLHAPQSLLSASSFSPLSESGADDATSLPAHGPIEVLHARTPLGRGLSAPGLPKTQMVEVMASSPLYSVGTVCRHS